MRDVVFTGHVTNIWDYYGVIDLLVIPSYSEGLPNVLLEGMAAGVPVVSTRVGAVEEVLKDMPLNMVEAGDSDALAERMVRFLADKDLAEMSVAKGRKIIAGQYDPGLRAERLVSLYYRVLQQENGGRRGLEKAKIS